MQLLMRVLVATCTAFLGAFGHGICSNGLTCIDDSDASEDIVLSLLQKDVSTNHKINIEPSSSASKLLQVSESGVSWVVSQQSPGSLKKLKVLGLQHTGTHLLHNVLIHGFGTSISSYDPNFFSELDCGFWKHSSLTNILQETPHDLEQCKKQSYIGLAVIRNPLDWLDAVRRCPYELSACTPGEDWLIQPCTFDNAPQVSKTHLDKTTFPNLGSIWSQWNKDYEHLDSFDFQQHLLIRYEDLVLDAVGTFRKIATVANLSAPDTDGEIEFRLANILQGPKHRNAVEVIKSRSRSENFNELHLSQACARLDIALMRRHGYYDCDGVVNSNN